MRYSDIDAVREYAEQNAVRQWEYWREPKSRRDDFDLLEGLERLQSKIL